MPRISNSTITGIDATNSIDLEADLIQMEKVGEMDMICWDAQFIIQMIEGLRNHIVLKT